MTVRGGNSRGLIRQEPYLPGIEDDVTPTGEPGVGAVRRTRSSRSTAASPYPTGKQDEGRNGTAATVGRAALLWRCPRSGIRWVPSAWESREAPAQTANQLALRFVTTLASDLSESVLEDCGSALERFTRVNNASTKTASSSQIGRAHV